MELLYAEEMCPRCKRRLDECDCPLPASLFDDPAGDAVPEEYPD
jgi:hypothetical protein